MFKKKQEHQALEDFMATKELSPNKTLHFHIKEIKSNNINEPQFKLYILDEYKQLEINIGNEQENRMELNEMSNFINSFKKEYPDFRVFYLLNALNPQYAGVLSEKLDKLVETPSNSITVSEIITDIDQEKVVKLTVKQQKELFIELCFAGNYKPLNKLLDSCALAEHGNAFDIKQSTYSREDFTKFDVVFGLERATSYGHLNVVKTILENKNMEKLFDFSDASSDLLNVLYLGLEKERKEIISYILDEKQYKLNKEEIYLLQKNKNDPFYAEVLNDYESKQLNTESKPKM